jgi:hypothetical protein
MTALLKAAQVKFLQSNTPLVGCFENVFNSKLYTAVISSAISSARHTESKVQLSIERALLT